MKKGYLFICFAIVTLFLVYHYSTDNLNNDNNPIQTTVVKKYISNKSLLAIKDNVNYELLTSDTIKYNSSASFEKSIQKLQLEINKIDKLGTNNPTKCYLKSLIIADFVYASFSFQFLGPKLGMAQDASAIKNWNELPLEACFDFGNKNQYAVFCGERTIFFNRLVSHLLQLKTKQISIKGVHTFPLVEIDKKEYIIDPYDPFVAIDTYKNIILDYKSIITKKYQTLLPFRTKRTFGHSRILISNKFYQKLQKAYGQLNLPTLLEIYLAKNGAYLSKFKPNNFEVPIETTKAVRIVLNNKNTFAIEINGRIDGNLNNEKDFNKYYIKPKH